MRKIVALAMLIAGVFVTGEAQAQQPAQRRWEPRGFDFRPDGVWRRRAREVGRLRRQALARGDFALLNEAISVSRQRPQLLLAPGATISATAVIGVLRVPTLLVRYKDTNPATSFAPAGYDQVLFGTVPQAGQPYSVRTFYEEMSERLFSVQGVVVGWITLDSNETWYTGPKGCNGILCNPGPTGSHVAQFISEAVQKADPSIDWSLFDGDGDGYVDLVWLIHPTLGGECGDTLGMWAHRFFYEGWTGGAPLVTADGGKRIGDYTLQSGLGGDACTAGLIMAPGVTAHELGHGLGLPDLYDTDANGGEGIGEWGLMGSGNWARPRSPAHMESWSLAQLGWIALRPADTAGSYTLAPVQTADTALVLRPPAGVANPRGEYFLLENRQALESDTALIAKGKAPGLLVWHVDSTKIVTGSAGNNVNAGSIYGVWLMQADGLNQLRIAGIRNRGDGGDPFPGITSNTAFGPLGAPAATLNTAGAPGAGVLLDSIRQVTPGGAMAFRLRFGGPMVIRASDTTALVSVRGTAYHVFRAVLEDGDTATVAIDSVQLRNAGRSSLVFAGWSDVGARSHVVTGTLAGDTVVATVVVKHQVDVTTAGTGSISSTVVTGAPVFVAAGTPVSLTAVPGDSQAFVGWSGDTTTMHPTVTLPMNRPYTLTATFVPTSALLAQFLVGGTNVSAQVAAALDAAGNANGTLDLGDLVAWLDATGAQPAPSLMRRLLERIVP